ncbi:MAG: hypothetical protein SFV22_16180 [Saprospiraceae bacterium]|nr:hypothetical protein [Saprospiraceae bacterium]
MRRPVLLLAENDPLIALDLRLQLEDARWQVHDVVPGELAECCRQQRPDGILLNFNSHGPSDGMALARALKTQFNLPVLLITGARLKDLLASSDFTPDIPVLYKPFTPCQLQQCLSPWRSVTE